MAEKQPAEKATIHKYPFWAPRSWHGMGVATWFGLLARNRFAISPTRLPMVFAVTICAFLNSFLAGMQGLLYGGRVRRAKLAQPPVFIIGHWRSGTTHLHDLMALDERFISPTTYECSAPSHSLISAWLITKLTFLLPAQRPMDNMSFGWDRPQEDEFALLTLGAGSPYETMAFPNRRPVRHEFLTLQGISPDQRRRWQQTLDWFLRMISVRGQRQQQRKANKGKEAVAEAEQRVVLKSPPHTARIAAIRELYPDARFIHIVRNPYSLFSSNVRLWKSLYDVQGCQVPRFERRGDRPSIEEYVFNTFNEMYGDFDAQKAATPESHFCEVRYEDLVRNPLAELRHIYDHLELGGFERAAPQIEAYLAGVKDYQPNKHSLPAETCAAVTEHWGDFIRKYGYATEAVAANA